MTTKNIAERKFCRSDIIRQCYIAGAALKKCSTVIAARTTLQWRATDRDGETDY